VKVLKLQCLPDAIPDHVEADVTGLKKDVKFTIKDVKLPAGVKSLQDPDLLVAIVQEHKVEEIVPAAGAVPGALEPEVIKKEKAEDAEGAEKDAKGGGEKKDAAKKEEKK
jgi:large subunit ribosomal protein L25